MLDFVSSSITAMEGGHSFDICLSKKQGSIAEGTEIQISYEISGQKNGMKNHCFLHEVQV